MILSIGGVGVPKDFTWEILNTVLHDSAISMAKDKIVANGYFPLIVGCESLNMRSMATEMFERHKREIAFLEKDFCYWKNIFKCFRLSKPPPLLRFEPFFKEGTKGWDTNFTGDSLGEPIAKSAEPMAKYAEQVLSITLFVELFDIRTGRVFQQKIHTLWEAYFFSFLHPGLISSTHGIYNTMYLTGFPCLSFLTENREKIRFVFAETSYHRYSTIEKLFKTIQFLRSRALSETALAIISEQNEVILKELREYLRYLRIVI